MSTGAAKANRFFVIFQNINYNAKPLNLICLHVMKIRYRKSLTFLSNAYNLHNSSIANQMSIEKTQSEKDISHTGNEGSKHEKTEILIGAEVTRNQAWEFFSNISNKFDGCASSAAPSIAMTIFRDAYKRMKSRGIKIRWVTDITKDNLTHCKALMQYAEVRHISHLNGNFAVSETEYIAADTIKEGQPLPKLIYSNSKEMVEQHQYLFLALWDKGVPAEHRIR